MRPVPFTSFTTLRGLLTPGQRAFTRVAYDGVEPVDLTGPERESAHLIWGGAERLPETARRVAVQLKGRDVGGTRCAAERGVHLAWTVPVARTDLDELLYGVLIGPKIRHARVALRFALSCAEKNGLTVENTTQDGFTLVRPDGRRVRFECFAASRGGDNARGVSIIFALLDEAAFFFDELTGVANGEGVFGAIIPRLLPGGQIVIVSSPWIESGLLHSEFTRNYGHAVTAIAAFCPTTIMRDDAETLAMSASEHIRDPENWRRELGAEFLTGGSSGSLIGPELLRPSFAQDYDPFSPGPTFIGGDLGLIVDASAFVAIRRARDLLIVVDILELRPRKGTPLKLSEVIARASEFTLRNGGREIICDHHELQAGREHLRGNVTMKAAAGGQAANLERYLRLREAFRQGRVRIPQQHARLADQLALVASRPASGGGTSILLPRRAGSHQDVASAAVLAFSAATRRYGKMATALMNLTAADCLRLEESAARQNPIFGGRRF